MKKETYTVRTSLHGFTKGKGCTKFGKNLTKIVVTIEPTDTHRPYIILQPMNMCNYIQINQQCYSLFLL